MPRPQRITHVRDGFFSLGRRRLRQVDAAHPLALTPHTFRSVTYAENIVE